MSLARAIETGDLAELPSRRDEDWRWTDLRGLLRVLPGPTLADAAAPTTGPFAAVAAHRIEIANGRGETHYAVAKGRSDVLDLRFLSTGSGSHVARFTIEIGQGASLRLLESHEGAAADYVREIDLAITIGQGGALDRVVLMADCDSAISVVDATVTLGVGARLSQTVLTDGAKRQRVETRVVNPGGGASVRLDGVYLPAAKRHADITTIVTHTGVGGTTDQLVKGVVRDQARGVFQGRIVVRPGADKTDARMGHHALILSDRAEVDAKPELEIYADDVACAHGNTVGSLDEEALFYAGQRGIPDGDAVAMLTRAFVGEAIDRIEDAAVRGVCLSWAQGRLERP
ncbi:MAG: Fe-S cluster assembly protein SufD [Caulobacteraceae bacterium]